MNHKNDELYTPRILVDAIVPYLKGFSNRFKGHEHRLPNVWCPFDTENSEFVMAIGGLKGEFVGEVVHTHISEPNGDFFRLVDDLDFMKKVDLVVSNPPFSRKLEIFRLLNGKGIPFALICNTEALNYQEIGEYFAETPMSFVIPDKKVSFDGNTASFNSSFFCSTNFFGVNSQEGLKPTIEFVHLDNNNSKGFFKGSAMYKDKNSIDSFWDSQKGD